MTDNLTLAYALILIGMVLLVAELFIPSFGVLTALAVGAMVLGIASTFRIDQTTGVVTLLTVFVVTPVLMAAVFHYAPRTAFGKRLFLTGPREEETAANMPVNQELLELRGRYGRTVSPLRPAGTAEFDGRRVDVLSEGALVEPGQWVRCLEVSAGKVIVRQVDRPPDPVDFDTATFT